MDPKAVAIPCRTLNSKERKDVVRLGDPCEHVPGLTKDDPTQVPTQRPYEAQQLPRRIVAANQSSRPQDTREIILGKTRMRWLSSCAQVPWVPSSPPRCPQSQIFVPHPHSGLASDYYFFFFHKRKVASTSSTPPVCAATLLCCELCICVSCL